MNQKELTEIRKTMNHKRNCVYKIAGCYVDTEKNKRACGVHSFSMMSEEEELKYYELFKKALSGKIGKNQINLEFPKEAYENDGIQPFLYDLVKDGLANESKIQELFDRIIDTYDYPDNYYILVAYGDYDVPEVGKDGVVMEDASEDVYSFINCSICPMKPSKPGLAYNDKQDQIENAIRNMMVEVPVHGFLFPAFNDRKSDIHSVLYYTKKPEDMESSFVREMLTCIAPQTAKGQNNSFVTALESSTEERTLDQVITVCQSVYEIGVENEDKGDMELDSAAITRILSAADFDGQEIDGFKEEFKKETDSTEVMLTNVFDGGKKITIESGCAKFQIPTEMADYLSVKKIDGANCLVLRLHDDLTVNGVKINKFN